MFLLLRHFLCVFYIEDFFMFLPLKHLFSVFSSTEGFFMFSCLRDTFSSVFSTWRTCFCFSSQVSLQSPKSLFYCSWLLSIFSSVFLIHSCAPMIQWKFDFQLLSWNERPSKRLSSPQFRSWLSFGWGQEKTSFFLLKYFQICFG